MVKQINKITAYLAGLALLLAPSTAFAAATLAGVIGNIQGIVAKLFPFLIGFGALFIVWGALVLVFEAGDEAKRKTAIARVQWGVVGVAVMISVWGLVNIVAQSFGVTPITSPAVMPGF